MNQKLLIRVFAVILGLGLLIAFMLFSGPATYDWSESYRPDKKEPYGTSVFYELLENYFPNNSFSELNKSIKDLVLEGDSLNPSTYIFTGSYLYQDNDESKLLRNFVQKGNTALIICYELPEGLGDLFYDTTAVKRDEYYGLRRFTDSLVTANFYDGPLKRKKDWKFHYQQQDKIYLYNFQCFDSLHFTTDRNVEAIAYIDSNYANFARVKYGKGEILFHTAPLFFTNFHLINPDRAEYVSSVLSYLPEGDIYWDEYGRKWRPDVNMPENPADQPANPLKFIMDHPPLRWALYLLVAATFTGLLFGLRRQQRIIPVIEPIRNSSLEFLQTVGRLYFLQKQHPRIIRHQMRYFFTFIREKYRIHTNELTSVAIEQLHLKSGITKEHLQNIADQYQQLSNYVELDDAATISFYQLLSHFYKNCRK